MTGSSPDLKTRKTRPAAIVAAGLFALASASALAAEAPCGICARAVVTNSSLAACFLAKYPELERRTNGAVAVDLSDCEQDRGVVAALPGPRLSPREEPDLQFILSASQLACLKARLEEPGLALDPSARIDLDKC